MAKLRPFSLPKHRSFNIHGKLCPSVQKSAADSRHAQQKQLFAAQCFQMFWLTHVRCAPESTQSRLVLNDYRDAIENLCASGS